MRFGWAGLAFSLPSLAFLLAGCLAQPFPIGGSEAEQVRARFDGYDWSWQCWSEEVKFTLWKEHISKVEKIGNYWIIEGASSDRGNVMKSVSSDKSGKVLFVYDKQSDKVVNMVHGDYGWDVRVGPDGNISGSIPLYC
ncbi:MAG: hypothetical protein QW568_04730 [Candidatus Anstonellaceae archaeon]